MKLKDDESDLLVAEDEIDELEKQVARRMCAGLVH